MRGVELVEPLPQVGGLVHVAGRFGAEQVDVGVAQSQERLEFWGSVPEDRSLAQLAADDLQERSVVLVEEGSLVALEVVAEHLLCLAHALRALVDRRPLDGVRGSAHGQAGLAGLPGDRRQGVGQVCCQVGAGAGADGDVLIGELAAGDVEGSEDHLRVLGEVAVDQDVGVGADLHRRQAHPFRGCGGHRAVAPAQDEQIGHGVGSGHAAVCSGREPHGADQVRAVGDLQPRRLAHRVERVPAGQDRDEAAGPDQLQGLDDEVVVGGQPQGVVDRVVQRDLVERHVPDGGVEVALREAGVDEGFRPDGRVGVEGCGDLRGDRVEFDAGHLRGLRGEGEEVPGAAARLQDPAFAESQVLEGFPDRLHESGVGEVGVPGGGLGGVPLALGEQGSQLLTQAGQFPLAWVEDARHGAPRTPAGQNRLFVSRGGPLLLAEDVEGADRGDVRSYPSEGARRGEVLLPLGPVPDGLSGPRSLADLPLDHHVEGDGVRLVVRVRVLDQDLGAGGTGDHHHDGFDQLFRIGPVLWAVAQVPDQVAVVEVFAAAGPVADGRGVLVRLPSRRKGLGRRCCEGLAVLGGW